MTNEPLYCLIFIYCFTSVNFALEELFFSFYTALAGATFAPVDNNRLLYLDGVAICRGFAEVVCIVYILTASGCFICLPLFVGDSATNSGADYFYFLKELNV